jgi:putative oxidoreductase
MLRDIGFTQLLILAALAAALYGMRKSLPKSTLRGRQAPHEAVTPTTLRHRLLLLEITEVVLAAVFFIVGGAKLVGRSDMVALFQDIGIGQWLRYVTGTLEVMGAALLVVPLLSAASALVLGAVMIVATLIELFVLHRPPVAALACLTGHTFVAWARVSRWHEPSLRRATAQRGTADRPGYGGGQSGATVDPQA